MQIERLADLTYVPRRAVIINVSTKWATTLALLSALRYSRMPTLVVDCESKDGSLDHFSGLMADHEFDLITAPLQPHGLTLDEIFRKMPAEDILLIDSDAEILNRAILDLIDSVADHPRLFGAGFIHGPEWLGPSHFFEHERMGMYHERMWIPFTLLSVPKVCEAIDAGKSFIDRMIYNDFAPSPRASRWLHGRFRRRTWRHARLDFLDPFRRAYYNAKPRYVYCDTGADIYQYLKYECDYLFAGLPARLHGRFIAHYHGLTRRTLNAQDTNATSPDEVMNAILSRLRIMYDLAVPHAQRPICGP